MTLTWIHLAITGATAMAMGILMLLMIQILLRPKAKAHCVLQARLRFMAAHEVEVNVIENRSPEKVSSQLLYHKADPRSSVESEALLSDVNNKTLQFIARSKDIVVAEKIIKTSIKSRSFYNDDYFSINLTGKDSGVVSSYHSVINENF